MYWDFWVRVPDQFAIYQGHLRPRSFHAELGLAAHLRAGSSELGPQQWLFLSLAPALALTTSQPLLPLALEQRRASAVLGGGGEPAWEPLRNCSSCLEIQIAANLSSPERNCIWQFRCFSRFDAPICLRGGEEWNWAMVSRKWRRKGSRESHSPGILQKRLLSRCQ